MPEAPEVTVAARQLRFLAVGRTVEAVSVTHPRTTRAQPPQQLATFVGARITAVDRHGKWIVVAFDDVDDRLGIHLRMSGQLLARTPGDVPADRHVHARLLLGGSEVWFRDPRTFGELRVISGAVPVAADLHDPALTPDDLARDAAARRVGVKAVLLDQTRTVSGIGSYLADEALHRAGIAPRTPSSSLHLSAWERVLAAARDIAAESAAVGGVTLPDEGWIDLWGRPGRYAAQLRVHGRTACATCGNLTRTAVVGGRSARWCPRCQDHRRRR